MSSTTLTFEKLESWKKARQVTRNIYHLTRSGRLGRDFGVCGQIQRAAVSVMSNVAEGFERYHVPEKLQFYNIARGSAAEVRSLLYVVEDNFPELATDAVNLRSDVEAVGQLVSGLIRSTEERRTKLRGIIALTIVALLLLFA